MTPAEFRPARDSPNPERRATGLAVRWTGRRLLWRVDGVDALGWMALVTAALSIERLIAHGHRRARAIGLVTALGGVLVAA